MNTTDIEVKHGFTLTDLEKMTRAAVVADRLLVGDGRYRHGIAYSAIAEALFASEEPPERGHLIRVGWQAIALDVRWSLRHAGYPDDGQPGDDKLRPRFVQYWQDQRVTPSHEPKIVEELAAHQVTDTLSPVYRDALIALAVHGTYQAAADALGISYVALKARIATARRRVLADWFEGETPRRTHHVDRRVGAYNKAPATHCSNGHEWTPENTHTRRRMVRGKQRSSRACRACESERGAARWKATREAREGQAA